MYQKRHQSNQDQQRIEKSEADWFTIIWMITIHVIALFAFWNFSWGGFFWFLGLYFATGCLGITFCFHRLLSHRSFKAHPLVEGFTALMGTLALQGTVQQWVSHHRLHHQGSDTPRDPHNARRGFWYSHWGWLFQLDANRNQEKMAKNTKDILANPWLLFLSHINVMIFCQIILGFILLFAGGASWVLWGIFLRLVAVYHTTWLVNSATHKWGYRNFASNDLAVNTWWVAILTWGEGWHNNHHRFANVCPARYRWWEIDITYSIVCILEYFGLVSDVKHYPKEADEEFERLQAAKVASQNEQIHETELVSGHEALYKPIN
ncbi:MAG: acyl-CoA desaturase [Oligoflexales bacterium]